MGVGYRMAPIQMYSGVPLYYDADGEILIEKVAPGASGYNVHYLRQIHCVPSSS